MQFTMDGAHSASSAQEQLLDYLGERSTLLVLDNFEHLVDGADLLGEIIERAPNVELLTTSRERLNVQSEWVLDVHGRRRRGPLHLAPGTRSADHVVAPVRDGSRDRAAQGCP